MYPYSPLNLIRVIANSFRDCVLEAVVTFWSHPIVQYIFESLCWLLLNDIDFRKLPERQAFRRSLDAADYGLSRRGEIREYAEYLYESSKKGSQSSNDRVEKLLGVVLVATGWIATKDPYVFTLLTLIASSLVLLMGRWKVVSSAPLDFQSFAATASQYKKSDKSKDKEDQQSFDLDIACQYALAAWEINYRNRLTHVRLLIGILLLLLGLVFAALRV